MKRHLRKDWLKWVAACFALVATASAEYELARAIGMDEWVAVAVPGALDAYVLRALRAHREVLTAVLAMVGVNAASHLLTAGHLYLDWPLITAVSAIAPLVLWRVHALGTPGEARRRALWGASTAELDEHEPLDMSPCLCSHGYSEHARADDGYVDGPCTLCACKDWHDEVEHARMVACSVCVPEHTSTGCVLAHPECVGHDACTRYEKPSAEHVPGGACTCEHGMSTHNEHGCYSALCPCTYKRGTLPETVDTTPQVCSHGCTVWGDLGAHERAHKSAGWTDPSTFEEHVSTAVGVLDYVPREWVTPPVPEHAPDPVPGWDGTITEHVPEKRERVLKAVPDLPDGYVHAVLRPGDDAYLEQARVLHARGTALRDWKPVLGVGTARAQRLRDYINAEHDASTEEST